MKKIISLILALTMVFALAVTASAVTVNIPAASDNLSDATYTAYKVFDAEFSTDGSSVLYTIVKDDPFWDVVSTSDLFNLVESDTANTYTVTVANNVSAYQIVNCLKTTQSKGSAIESSSNGSKITLELDEGYYFIENEFDQNYILDTVGKEEITVQKKEEYPTVSKVIVDENDSEVETINASVGEVINFKVIVKIPESGLNGRFFKFEDTLPAGLTLIEDSIDTTNWPAGTNALGEYYYDAENRVFGWNFSEMSTGMINAGSELVLTYSAKVNSKAIVGGNGNINTAKAIDNDVPVEDTAVVYVREFTLKKTNTEGTVIEGAVFYLRTENKGVPGDQDYGTDIVIFGYDENTKTYTYEGTIGKNVDKDRADITAGEVIIKGLPDGEYYLYEYSAPDGYNKLTDGIKITVGNGISVNNSTDASADGVTITVVNESGATLPSTGGMGTTLFYVLGSLMAVTALVVLVTNKRMRT